MKSNIERLFLNLWSCAILCIASTAVEACPWNYALNEISSSNSKYTNALSLSEKTNMTLEDTDSALLQLEATYLQYDNIANDPDLIRISGSQGGEFTDVEILTHQAFIDIAESHKKLNQLAEAKIAESGLNNSAAALNQIDFDRIRDEAMSYWELAINRLGSAYRAGPIPANRSFLLGELQTQLPFLMRYYSNEELINRFSSVTLNDPLSSQLLSFLAESERRKRLGGQNKPAVAYAQGWYRDDAGRYFSTTDYDNNFGGLNILDFSNKPNTIGQEIVNGNDIYTWSNTSQNASNRYRIFITDVDGYLNHLNSKHYAGSLDAETRNQIRLMLNSKELKTRFYVNPVLENYNGLNAQQLIDAGWEQKVFNSLDEIKLDVRVAKHFETSYSKNGATYPMTLYSRDMSRINMGNIEARASLPGTHAENYVFNSLIAQHRGQFPSDFADGGQGVFIGDPKRLSERMTIATVNFQSNPIGLGFPACPQCEFIIPLSVNNIFGRKNTEPVISGIEPYIR